MRARSETDYGQPCRAIAIGADHGGFALKKQIIEYLRGKYPSISVTDCGCFSEDRVDYPDVCAAACRTLQERTVDRAILLDGAGVASGIACNKHVGIRAGVVHDHFSACMARMHSDCNVCCMGGKTLGIEAAKEIVDVFINAKFEGEKRVPTLAKIEAIEASQLSSYSTSYDSRRSVGGVHAASPYKLPL